MPSKPASTAPRLAFRSLLRCVDGKQAALAAITGLSPSFVSKILSGDRGIDWNELHAAADAIMEALPESKVEVSRALSLYGADTVVEPVATDPTPRDWAREVVDGMAAEARMHAAVLDEDLAAFDAAAEDALRECRERIAAGRQCITLAEGAAPRPRVVGRS